MKPKTPVVPFLKWPGGKRWASPIIADVLRETLSGTYYEPFLGGGAVFFRLRPGRAVLSDSNADLINTYRAVRDRAAEVLRLLKRLPVDETTFYRMRRAEPDDPLKRAVRFLYLNRTAFGGIYRLNSEGKFNVPYGGGERTPDVLWRQALLLTTSDALAGVRIHHADFEEIINLAKKAMPFTAILPTPSHTRTMALFGSTKTIFLGRTRNAWRVRAGAQRGGGPQSSSATLIIGQYGTYTVERNFGYWNGRAESAPILQNGERFENS